jgi:hypothetical protein
MLVLDRDRTFTRLHMPPVMLHHDPDPMCAVIGSCMSRGGVEVRPLPHPPSFSAFRFAPPAAGGDTSHPNVLGRWPHPRPPLAPLAHTTRPLPPPMHSTDVSMARPAASATGTEFTMTRMSPTTGFPVVSVRVPHCAVPPNVPPRRSAPADCEIRHRLPVPSVSVTPG